MSGRISFSWDIHYACNYRCQYCWFYGEWQKLALQNRYYPLSDLLKFWNNIYNKYGSVHIEIIGGEPFIYPNFTKLIKELSQTHTIAITTNLSGDPINFIKEVTHPENIKISPTFHPLFTSFDRFINHALLLKNAGMAGVVNYLAYPPQIEFINYYREQFAKHGLSLFVMTFWGEYKGISYPQGYTQQDRELIQPCLGHRQGKNFQLTPKEVKGKLCRAGQKHAVIKADGAVYRCGGNTPDLIGNLFSDDFKLLDQPLPCTSEFCPCNEWVGLLDEEKEIRGGKEGQERKTEGGGILVSSSEAAWAFHERDTKNPSAHKEEIDRKSIAPHRVFLTWDIHYGCNYKCTYCNTPKPLDKGGSWDKDRDKIVYPKLKRWIEVWEDIYKRYGSCEVHITGGEPFVYPLFLDLISNISKIHTLEIITNLSSDVNKIIKCVTADRVRIGTTFHPEFTSLEEFLKKHIILRSHGFETWANYVAYPPQLAKMPQYKKEFDKLNIPFNIQPFMGDYEGRKYPAGYTDSELSYLKECYDNEDIVNKKTVEWKTGTENKNTSGKPCRMGQMYAKIYPIGDAYRCCANNTKKLGNLIDGSFKLLDEALPCEDGLCYCWRCMLVEQEEKWSQHWVIPGRKI